MLKQLFVAMASLVGSSRFCYLVFVWINGVVGKTAILQQRVVCVDTDCSVIKESTYLRPFACPGALASSLSYIVLMIYLDSG